GAPVPALSPTGPRPEAVVAPPATPIEVMTRLPDASAAPMAPSAPLAAPAPQASIAPGMAASIALLSDMASDAGRIVIQAVPHGTAATLHSGKANPIAAASGTAAASFGTALFPAGAVPALAAALLGGSDDQNPDLADGLLQSSIAEATDVASEAVEEKHAGASSGTGSQAVSEQANGPSL